MYFDWGIPHGCRRGAGRACQRDPGDHCVTRFRRTIYEMHAYDLILTLTGGLAAALVLGYVTQRLGL